MSSNEHLNSQDVVFVWQRSDAITSVAKSMNGENRLPITNELVEIEKSSVEVQDFR